VETPRLGRGAPRVGSLVTRAAGAALVTLQSLSSSASSPEPRKGAERQTHNNEARTIVPTQISLPLVIQSDRTILLEVDHPSYAEARDALAQFAELEKSPEHIHTYRLTPLSLWNAAAAGLDAAQVIAALTQFSKYDLPPNVVSDVRDYIGRYGRLKLMREPAAEDGATGPGPLLLCSTDATLIAQVVRQKRLQPYILAERDPHTLVIDAARRGHVLLHARQRHRRRGLGVGLPEDE